MIPTKCKRKVVIITQGGHPRVKVVRVTRTLAAVNKSNGNDHEVYYGQGSSYTRDVPNHETTDVCRDKGALTFPTWVVLFEIVNARKIPFRTAHETNKKSIVDASVFGRPGP